LIAAKTIPAPPLTPTHMLTPPTTASSSASIDVTPTDPLRRRRSAPWLAISAAVVALGVGGWWVLTRNRDRAPEPTTPHSAPTAGPAKPTSDEDILGGRK